MSGRRKLPSGRSSYCRKNPLVRAGRVRRPSMPRAHPAPQPPHKTAQRKSRHRVRERRRGHTHTYLRRPLAVRYGHVGTYRKNKMLLHIPITPKAVELPQKKSSCYFFRNHIVFLACAGHISSASPASSSSRARSNSAE